MAEHKGKTDETKKVKLESSIQQVYWTRRVASPGGTVGIEVFTRNIGNGADLEVTIKEQSGKSFGSYKDKISGNHFWAEIKVPPDAKEALVATVKLSKHGLDMKSPALLLTPPLQITNVKWDKQEARRGDVLKLSADIKGVPDGSEAQITILEHDEDGAHDLITKFPVVVKNKKVEAEWEFAYHEDTDDIPTQAETEKGYSHPEYFFTVTIAGSSGKSELVRFKDWIEFHLQSYSGKEKYVLHLPDGSEKRGSFDSDGNMKEEVAMPGPYRIDIVTED